MMGEFLKAVCAERGFTAVTLAHNTGTSYPFGAFVHTSAGHCGHGTGETVEAAVQVAISDLHARFPDEARKQAMVIKEEVA